MVIREDFIEKVTLYLGLKDRYWFDSKGVKGGKLKVLCSHLGVLSYFFYLR